MSHTRERRLPRWPMLLVLSLVLVLDSFLLLLLLIETIETKTINIPMTVNSAGLVVLCVLFWRGLRWSRWILIALLVWRVASIVIAMALHFVPGDHRVGSSLIMIAFYAAVGLVLASPLGRSWIDTMHRAEAHDQNGAQ
ncbi:MAG: hypothetical protein JXB46_06530 [Candidatus Eisenbacteria bacterium]|nr:hypothetical protein [Candidatus Eisenbacteria bacterium]